MEEEKNIAIVLENVKIFFVVFYTGNVRISIHSVELEMPFKVNQ